MKLHSGAFRLNTVFSRAKRMPALKVKEAVKCLDFAVNRGGTAFMTPSEDSGLPWAFLFIRRCCHYGYTFGQGFS